MKSVNEIIIPSLGIAAIQQTLKDYLQNIDNEFQSNREMLLDFYMSQQTDKDEYLKDYFNRQTDATKNPDYPHNLILSQLNITSKLIDKKAKNYIQQPVRKIDGTVDEDYNDLLIDAGIKTTSKLIDRLTWLLGDNCTIFVADKETQKLKFFNPPYYIPLFGEYDNINPIGVLYPIGLIRNKGEDIEGWAYWDEENYIIFDNDWEIIEQKPNEHKVFNVLFTHRMKPFRSHWTKDAQDLIDTNRDINIAMTSINNAFRYVGFPVWAAIGIKQQLVGGSIKDQEGINPEPTVTIAFDKLMTLTPAAEGGSVDFKTVNPNVNWAGLLDTIKSRCQYLSSTWNVQFEIEGRIDISGLALKILSIDDTCDKDEMQELYEEFFEIPLFEKLKKASENISWLKVKGDKLTLDWYEGEFFETPTDKLNRLKTEIELNLTNPIDELKNLNPDLDDESALEMYSRNAKINKFLRSGGITKDEALDILLGKDKDEELDSFINEISPTESETELETIE